MRLALISFEFPPAVAIGGIGAYAWQAAIMMKAAGWDVEVFAAGSPGREPAEDHGIKVHRFPTENRIDFKNLIVDTFIQRHRAKAFDVLESPEIGAEGSAIAAACPELPVVVKLHTPTYLVSKVGYEPPSLLQKTRFSLGALARGRFAVLSKPAYQPEQDPERKFALAADEIAAPSQAIGETLVEDWSLDRGKVSCFPLPFCPDPELLNLPIPGNVTTVGFLGRLEARKGVVELAKAIPAILKRRPDLRFRFIGPSWPFRGSDMESYIRGVCRKHLDQLEFTGPVARPKIPEQIRSCDIVVLPSRWENFPFACWEMMAAGRAVIASNAGGMRDVIEDKVSGLLIPPHDPQAIMEAVLWLCEDKERVSRLGTAARARVLDLLNPERVLLQQTASYHRAIARRSKKVACA
ncbi:glycosyltransferase family 4 protein [Luteolibacter luteus]|uniref:Glycosyltransferase family 4 protein n=1 Tax=Luteolibacter luteus TaxID=2728835 RepID=A0A858RD11_9BACT|nr:glycosyltransferase family 4 protein [Luteolibacter luteus]QJE94279.1 glycosyltransferase family 4 protein [Luteolibacter luteus]